MIDVVKLLLSAGNGGMGRVAFYRDKRILKGGPDGGDGGNGGHIIIKASNHRNTLAHFFGKTSFSAQDGGDGGKKKMRGRTGDSIELEVPLGTQILLCAENQASFDRRTRYGLDYKKRLADVRRQQYQLEREGQKPEPQSEDQPSWLHDQSLFEKQHFVEAKTENIVRDKHKYVLLRTLENDGDSLILCQGGFGGRGNDYFKGPERVTPLIAEYGTLGEVKAVLFELKLLADIGLVGYPNAGKSTLLNALTKARAKIGAYPFTTTEPNLGTLMLDASSAKEVVLADIPGLIEGASQGKGLGYQFLRHVENTKALQFVLFLDEGVLFDHNLSDEKKAKLLWEQYQNLRLELEDYDATLLQKPFIVTLSKADLYSLELIEKLKLFFDKKKIELLVFSASTATGLDDLKKQLQKML